MEIPSRVAWCNLLWTANGGKVEDNGLPILSPYMDSARGYCDRAVDCNECLLLQKFCDEQRSLGRNILWECATCAFTPAPGELRAVPGYYTSLLWATNDERNTEKLDPICLRCGRESAFLQLVLRVKE